MNDQPAVAEYESPAATRRPFTIYRITIWLAVAFAAIFAVSRWIVPLCANDYLVMKMRLPGITAAFLHISAFLTGTPAAIVFALIAILAPIVYVRLAADANAPPAQFAYRRLLAIHLVTCALLFYLVVAGLCLALPYVQYVRSLRS